MRRIVIIAIAVILVALLAGCAGEEADKTPPVISGVSASDITRTTASVSWTTDEPATSQVEYGLTTSYGSTAAPSTDSLVTSHSVTLSDLDENTTYHYRVKSGDESVNEAVSGDYTFTTTKIFPDENLGAAVREAIGQPEGPICIACLAEMESLYASERAISDIAGLEYCTGLVTLSVPLNQISDIASLSNLTTLRYLDSYSNQISDISPLSDLTSLTHLGLGDNQISDISPLSSLANLQYLHLADNQISDITPLSELNSLQGLYIHRNLISDISSLANLTGLTTLYVNGNQISNISAIANLTNLTTLYLDTNQISDISPLSDLTSLTALYLWGNQISDITPLVNNPGLGDGDTVDLRGNPLGTESLCTLIPQLQARGVEVLHDEPVACIAYIYSSDTQTANSYKSLLEDNDYSVTLIPMSNVATTDFSVYRLIILGGDTGYTITWGDTASVAAITDSGKPVIGLGEGGYAYFGKLALETGYPHGAHGDDNSIYVVDTSHSIFNMPNSIAIPGDDIIQLYTTTNHVGIGLSPIPGNVVALGREADDVGYYPLTLENGRYLLWGFTASPDNMTQVGKDLFLNVVDFMLGAS